MHASFSTNFEISYMLIKKTNKNIWLFCFRAKYGCPVHNDTKLTAKVLE